VHAARAGKMHGAAHRLDQPIPHLWRKARLGEQLHELVARGFKRGDGFWWMMHVQSQPGHPIVRFARRIESDVVRFDGCHCAEHVATERSEASWMAAGKGF